MKTIKLIAFFLVIASLNTISCDNAKTSQKTRVNSNQSTSVVDNKAKLKNLEVNISGMTCEIGCAKTIESKISKLKGVSYSKVSFSDSIGHFTFDTRMISAKTIIAKIDGIAGGEVYKVTDSKESVTFVTK
jgi:Cu+-exporting ATPase